jgi:hypothetical protein
MRRRSREIGRPAIVSGTGRRSTFASKGRSCSNNSVAPPSGRYFVRRVVCSCTLVKIGDPASEPPNSPICHCLVSIHNASRISAFRARSKLVVRGRASQRLNTVTVGKRRRSMAVTISGTGNTLTISERLRVAKNAIGDCKAGADRNAPECRRHHRRWQQRRVRREIQLRWLDRTLFGEIECVVQRADEIGPLPKALACRRRHDQD